MVTITSRNQLTQDLAVTHRSLTPARGPSAPEIEADFTRLMADGYVIIEGLIDRVATDAVRAACTPLLDRTGRNSFEGVRTQRLYNVLSKTRAADRLADHPRVLGLLDRLFRPNYLLSQMQAINILPGEDAQLLHCDDGFYRWPRPRPPLGAATIWAIDDFTSDNGATAIIPQSHQWGEARIGQPPEAIPVVMPAGSVVVFLGTTWHGGGANKSENARLAFTCQYCEPYLRQQENFLLELNGDTLRALSPELRSMVGYSVYPPFMGMVDGTHPLRLLGA